MQIHVGNVDRVSRGAQAGPACASGPRHTAAAWYFVYVMYIAILLQFYNKFIAIYSNFMAKFVTILIEVYQKSYKFM